MESAEDELFDAVVIGTGFGGAVAACRLVQAGKKICVLERGRRYAPVPGPGRVGEAGDFPRAGGRPDHLPHTARWMWALDHGLWDVDDLSGALAVHAAGYGGGSLVYASVHLRPPVQAFTRWPAIYQDRTELDPYYDLVAAVLRVQPLPDGSLPKADAMERVAGQLGRKASFFRPPLAIDFGRCAMSGGCITGCQGSSRGRRPG